MDSATVPPAAGSPQEERATDQLIDYAATQIDNKDVHVPTSATEMKKAMKRQRKFEQQQQSVDEIKQELKTEEEYASELLKRMAPEVDDMDELEGDEELLAEWERLSKEVESERKS